MELTVDVKLDFSGLKPIEKICEKLNNTYAISGVLDADAETLAAAKLNEEGGKGVYTDGKYAGEEVDIPRRSFIELASKLREDTAFAKATHILKNDFTESGVDRAIETLGQEIEEAQNNALYYNGSGIAGWLQHNEPRTIETKGFDRPLWSRRGQTFPISHKVVTK